MKRCRFSAKGQRGAHDYALVIPDEDRNPLILACMRCGNVLRHEVQVVERLAADDLPSDAIERLVKRIY